MTMRIVGKSKSFIQKSQSDKWSLTCEGARYVKREGVMTL